MKTENRFARTTLLVVTVLLPLACHGTRLRAEEGGASGNRQALLDEFRSTSDVGRKRAILAALRAMTAEKHHPFAEKVVEVNESLRQLGDAWENADHLAHASLHAPARGVPISVEPAGRLVRGPVPGVGVGPSPAGTILGFMGIAGGAIQMWHGVAHTRSNRQNLAIQARAGLDIAAGATNVVAGHLAVASDGLGALRFGGAAAMLTGIRDFIQYTETRRIEHGLSAAVNSVGGVTMMVGAPAAAAGAAAAVRGWNLGRFIGQRTVGAQTVDEHVQDGFYQFGRWTGWFND